MKGLLQKASKFVVKESNDDTRIIKGYASVFGNTDGDMDIIHKGAFNRSIKEWGPEGKNRIKLVAQHDISRPVAKITTLKEDEKGLYMEAKFGTHRDGEDYYRMAKDGIVDEFSVGFIALDKDKNEKGGYDITSIKLYEVSMVTVAANDEAIVTDVKSANPLKLVKQVEDEDLRFKLEKEMLRLMAETQETTTEAEVRVGTKEVSPEQEVEQKSDTISDLLELYKS